MKNNKENFNELFKKVFDYVNSNITSVLENGIFLNEQILETDFNNRHKDVIYDYLKGVIHNANGIINDQDKNTALEIFKNVAANLRTIEGQTTSMNFVVNATMQGKNRDAFTFIKEELGAIFETVQQELQSRIDQVRKDIEIKTEELKNLVNKQQEKSTEATNLQNQIVDLTKQLNQIKGSEDYKQEDQNDQIPQIKHEEAQKVDQNIHIKEQEVAKVQQEIQILTQEIETKNNEVRTVIEQNQEAVAQNNEIQLAQAQMMNNNAKELAKIQQQQEQAKIDFENKMKEIENIGKQEEKARLEAEKKAKKEQAAQKLFNKLSEIQKSKETEALNKIKKEAERQEQIRKEEEEARLEAERQEQEEKARLESEKESYIKKYEIHTELLLKQIRENPSYKGMSKQDMLSIDAVILANYIKGLNKITQDEQVSAQLLNPISEHFAQELNTFYGNKKSGFFSKIGNFFSEIKDDVSSLKFHDLFTKHEDNQKHNVEMSGQLHKGLIEDENN